MGIRCFCILTFRFLKPKKKRRSILFLFLFLFRLWMRRLSIMFSVFIKKFFFLFFVFFFFWFSSHYLCSYNRPILLFADDHGLFFNLRLKSAWCAYILIFFLKIFTFILSFLHFICTKHVIFSYSFLDRLDYLFIWEVAMVLAFCNAALITPNLLYLGLFFYVFLRKLWILREIYCFKHAPSILHCVFRLRD